MEDIRRLLRAHLSLYPGMEPADCIKLLYQNEMGIGHLLEDKDVFTQWLVDEMRLPELFGTPRRPPESIGNGLCRVHLSQLDKGPSSATFTRLCAASAAQHGGSLETLMQKLAVLRDMASEGQLPYHAETVNRLLDEYIADGCPAIHHSGRFTALYQPHYRVLDEAGALYLPVLAEIDRALAQKPHVLVGIDGMSAAGKSRLAQLLQEIYRCGLVHTDDFFLRPEQRSYERLVQPGGNIDYERLAPVAAAAADDRPFAYQKFDCRLGAMGEVREVPEGPLTLLEGVYALHPKVAAACDVRVFLSVDAGVQAQRVLQRSGPQLAARFTNEWIPMENRYFTEFDIRESCDVILDTTRL